MFSLFVKVSLFLKAFFPFYRNVLGSLVKLPGVRDVWAGRWIMGDLACKGNPC